MNWQFVSMRQISAEPVLIKLVLAKLILAKVWLIVLFFSHNLSASSVALLDKQGEGEMNYLFWTLYKAEYFIEPQHAVNEQTSALRITYYKSISKQALIEATEDQWRELGYKPMDILLWLEPLKQIWPDVSKGDQLTFVQLANGAGEFYFADQAIGRIDDNGFSSAFLSIWLSENTSEPELRRQLLGELQ
ncbi:hypothetical protein MACH09_12380 [Vibrio sp. MACH09]|uniref:chalcone isomerase family protein n=1 Tax=Vibrio sp. MACH09 TaxID=3025122 RepID=UPI002794B1A7|nr:chalcone isomerase family protein [Vibrio sp. MACH09]GLO60730.1 hypothetical protein MACH09_12380 [Vibrio sp. MACH09]